MCTATGARQTGKSTSAAYSNYCAYEAAVQAERVQVKNEAQQEAHQREDASQYAYLREQEDHKELLRAIAAPVKVEHLVEQDCMLKARRPSSCGSEPVNAFLICKQLTADSLRKKQNRERTARHRARETPEARIHRLERERLAKARRRAADKNEQSMNALRMYKQYTADLMLRQRERDCTALQMSQETPEESAWQLEQDCLAKAKKQAPYSNEHPLNILTIYKQLTADLIRRQRDRDRTALRRARETPEKRAWRLERDRLAKARKRTAQSDRRAHEAAMQTEDISQFAYLREQEDHQEPHGAVEIPEEVALLLSQDCIAKAIKHAGNNNELASEAASIQVLNGAQQETSQPASLMEEKGDEQNTHRLQPLATQQAIQLKKNPFQGTVCHKEFTVKRKLTRHLFIHTSKKPFKCLLCSKSFTWRGNLISHQKTHIVDKPFKCLLCNKTFNWKRNLICHQKSHTGEKPFKCLFCNKAFTYRGNLISHLKIHTGEKPFKCLLCNKAFTCHGNLISHQKIHTGEKPFKCLLCNKAFNRRGNLISHQRVHTREKPFKCLLCNKSFNWRGNLISHQEVHTREKQFKCTVCYKSYSSKRGWHRHQATHTREKSFNCLVCQRGFSQRGTQMIHQLVHSRTLIKNHQLILFGLKIFNCTLCNKSDIPLSGLVKHLLSHITERKFQCCLCNRLFFTKYKLTKHCLAHLKKSKLNAAHIIKSLSV